MGIQQQMKNNTTNKASKNMKYPFNKSKKQPPFNKDDSDPRFSPRHEKMTLSFIRR